MKWKLLPTKWQKDNDKEKQNQTQKEEKYLTPRDFFESFQRSIDEFFEDFGYPDFFSKERTFYPKVDVSEKDNEIIIKADVPGIDEKDLDVSITKDAVIIQGEKKYEHEEKHSNYYKKERSYGSFRRVIPLPVEIDESKAEATYKNGVVTIRLPKSQEAIKNVKKIPIKTS
ncbi:MAG: molecular chaperone Hsp20 [Leptospiraceae bacterium]|nr:MAG: molecular chaperone Hsp20 [Leptospiraceae bacterium]